MSIQAVKFWTLFPKAKDFLQEQCDLEMNSKDKNPSTEEEKAFERLKKFMAHGSVLERIKAAVGKDESESNVEIAHEILGPLCGSIVLNSHHKNELKKKQEACGANPCNHIQLPEDKNWGGLYLGKCEYRWQKIF